MTSPIARSNVSNRSPDFKMVLHIKLLTALRTLSQLVRCFRKTVLLTLYSGTDCSTRSTQLIKEWSEVPTNEHIYYNRVSVFTRMSLLPAMWMGQRTNCLQLDRLKKSRASRQCWLVVLRDRFQPPRVMSICITNKNKECFIRNWLYPSYRVKETVIPKPLCPGLR